MTLFRRFADTRPDIGRTSDPPVPEPVTPGAIARAARENHELVCAARSRLWGWKSMSGGVIEILEGAGQPRLLVVGDLMLDRFVYGTVERISPEAPVPVLRFQREVLMPGGAANVMRNMIDLGASVRLVGLAGDDASRFELERCIHDMPAASLALIGSVGRPTTTKTRLISEGQQIVRLDREEVHPANVAEEDAIIAAVENAIGEADCLVLSDYAKGTLTSRVVRAAIEAGTRRGIPIVVDPKTADFADYAGASVVTPNRGELERAIGKPCRGDDAIVQSANTLMAEIDIGALLVTRSEEGMTLVRRDEAPVHLSSLAREIFDVAGAGDTVVATLAVLLASGVALPEAAHVANRAAGLVVAKPGTATVTRGELVAEINRAGRQHDERKCAGLKEAVAVRWGWKDIGLRVVFTNGCFDLLHPGHLSLLRQAKAAGDRLIVGLNSDASVRRLKGETRPIQNQDSRALVLAALEFVDLVVIFSDDTPLELIEALIPDVLVKGADYAANQIVGRDFVERHGGRVVLARLEPGHSTTATLERFVP